MDRGARLEQALDQALSSAIDSSSTSVLLRLTIRVATLRQDVLALLWLKWEFAGLTTSTTTRADVERLRQRLITLVGPEAAEAQRIQVLEALLARREINDGTKKQTVGFGVSDLEAIARETRAIHDEPITPGMTPLDTGVASQRREGVKSQLAPLVIQHEQVLDRIRGALHEYLIQVEDDLLSGNQVADVIADSRLFVEKRLAEVAPGALAELKSAEERLAAGGEQALAHTATSARRAIKALADALLPAQEPIIDEDGVERVLDDERYRNRLVEFVKRQRGKSTYADLLASNIAGLVTRLKSLDDLASKGVHANVAGEEAASCVSWTYMLAADLLRVAGEATGPTAGVGIST